MRNHDHDDIIRNMNWSIVQAAGDPHTKHNDFVGYYLNKTSIKLSANFEFSHDNVWKNTLLLNYWETLDLEREIEHFQIYTTFEIYTSLPAGRFACGVDPGCGP